MSKADRPTPARDSAPSSAGARRTARSIPDSDTVPPARANGGSRLGLPREPVVQARTRGRRLPEVWVRRMAGIHPPAADLSHPVCAVREVATTLRLGAAPAVAGTRGSSALRWAESSPATRTRYGRFRLLREIGRAHV